MRIRRVAAATSVAVLALTALTACGSDDKDSKDSSSAAPADAKGSSDPKADEGKGGKDNSTLDAKALADAAAATMKEANFVKASGKGSDEDGKPETMDACLAVQTNSVQGTMTSDGQKIDIIMVDGMQYMKADAKFWAEITNNESNPAALAVIRQAGGDKYIKTEADKGEDLADFFEGDTDGYEKGAVTDFNGKKAIPLTKTADDTKTTYYIAASGKPFVIGQLDEGVGGSKERQEVSFTVTSTKCLPKAPAADQTVGAEEFGQAIEAGLPK